MPFSTKEQSRDYLKVYRLTHKKRASEQQKRWRSENQDTVVREHREWKAKVRALGFIPLNSPFPGCVGHHTDEEHVIYIPQKMHEKNWHSLKRNMGMDIINVLAYQWLRGF